jgi:hypothetical protein
VKPLTLNLTAVQDPAVKAALQQIQSNSYDTLQNDGSSSGTAIATTVGATLTSGGDELPYYTGQYSVAFAPFSAFGRAWVAALNASTALAGLPLQGYIGGLTLSIDATTPNSVLDIAAGVCADSTSATMITLGAITKTTGGAWAAGTGAFGMGTGLTIANGTWYHVFAVINAGAADVYFDTSVTAANAPAGTTAFRRIGSFLTNGSAHIIAFIQRGDLFLWNIPVTNDLANTSATVGTVQTLFKLTVPTGIEVQAIIYGTANSPSPAQAVLLSSPDTTGATTSVTQGQVTCPLASGYYGYVAYVFTNTAAQINIQGTVASIAIAGSTQGWIDTRGRFS